MKAEIIQRIRPTYGKDRVEIVTDADCEIITENGRCFIVRKNTQSLVRKYKIYRSSDLFQKDKPCESAYKGDVPDEYGNYDWYIDINNLEELHTLIEQTGRCVIVSKDSLGIYDDYRE